ncbi:MAG: hypothetical protein NTX64_04220 [Elusimicrobia bacterium]|nr:hypothetical protein [Elusimicrobiota bacterium]
MTLKDACLIAAAFALVVPALAQQQQREEMQPITLDGNHAYAIEGSSVSVGGADKDMNAAQAQEEKPYSHYIGGPEFQAGDPNAGLEPPTRLKRVPYVPGGSQSGSSSSSGSGSSSGSSGGRGDSGASGGYQDVLKQAIEFMHNPPYNSNNGSHDWAGWCLGFVNTTLRAAGHNPGIMYQPAAKDAYYAMAHANRISNDIKSVVAGAPLFWIGCSQWGHAAVATGEWSADGTPIMVTTSHNGIREMSTRQFGCGLPTGWGKI